MQLHDKSMLRHFVFFVVQRIALTISAGLVLAGLCHAQDAARMEEIVQSYVANQQFMGAVLVARGDEVLLNKGYGAANLEWNIPNSPTTKFRLGSLTKQFTAASILLLEERGKLKLDDPVKKYVKDAPDAWDKITIFNLLTHTSGIPNFTSFADYRSLEPFATTPDKLVARFRDKPLDFEPGARMSYSNSGYVLLGYVIEQITGASYETFVRNNIFTPLGMKDSGYDSNSALLAHRAAGYALGPNGFANAGFLHMSIPHAAGALYSTTEDLLRWEQGLFGGKLLSPASLAKMTTPFKDDYAFGLIVRTANGRRVIAHNGGIEGFNTALIYYPDDKVTIAVLGNVNGQAPGEIGNKLGKLVHGESVALPSERKEMSLSRATLTAYVGTYHFTPTVTMMITLDGDQLMEQLSGQNRLPIFPETETTFFLKAVDAQIEFTKDTDGAVTQLTLHQGGRDLNAKRTSSAAVAPPLRKEIVLPATMLNPYVGTYQMRPNVELSITRDGDQLMAQLTGQPRFPLFAESETRFFLKIADATLEFEKDPNGAVTAVTLRQGSIAERGPRK